MEEKVATKKMFSVSDSGVIWNTDGKYTAIFVEDEYVGGFTVYSPDWPGLVTVGETLDEASDMFIDAASGYFGID